MHRSDLLVDLYMHCFDQVFIFWVEFSLEHKSLGCAQLGITIQIQLRLFVIELD